MKMMNEALQYAKLGLSIIPVDKHKKALVQWQRYQKEKASEDQIKQWWKQWPKANIGIVTGTISGLAVIDIDTEEGKQAIQEYIPDSLVMPVVNTPSGGQHQYFKCKDTEISNNSRTVAGCDLRANGGYVVAPPSTNGNGKAYTWQEGLSIEQVALPELPAAYKSFINNSFIYKEQNSKSPQNSTESTKLHKMFTQGRRDNDLFHLANCLVKGGMNENNALQVLDILAENCTPPFPENAIQSKIQSTLNRSEKRDRMLSHEVREFVESTEGHFLSTEVHKSLDVSTKQEKKNVSEVLRRLCVEGVLEKYGNKNGCFRRVDDVAEKIDYLKADVEPFKIRLPLDIHKLVNLYNGNIITIAGAPNCGKTAFLLNVVEMNMAKHDIYYFSSEMGAGELRLRLSKFNRDLNTWKCDFRDRSDNFADVIKPGAINIIDFLEIHDEFWKVGGMIKAIHDKLGTKGLAIIAIQKNKDKDLGRGGYLALEKPRLYLTLNPGEAKIEKAKNYADPLNNPNGLVLDFKLHQGCEFSVVRDWYKPFEK
jgi:hypothetical protein